MPAVSAAPCARQFSVRRLWLLLLALPLVSGVDAIARPLGREWSPVESLNANGHLYMFPSRFEPTSKGTLRLVTLAVGGPGSYLTGFEWADSGWRVQWTHRYGSFFANEIPEQAGREWVVWRSFIDQPSGGGARDFMLASVVGGDSLATPDTIAVVSQSAVHYEAAASDSLEWVVAWDGDAYALTRSFTRRRSGGSWVERPLDIQGRAMYAVVGIDDTTALIVGSGDSLQWGRLTPSGWQPGGTLYENGYPSPFRSDGRGGWWLAWTNYDWMPIVTRWLPDGGWAPIETLAVNYPTSLYQVSKNNDLSRDSRPRPTMVWSSSGDDGVEHLYLAWPADSGWHVAEQVPGTESGITPKVARDENGDVWLAWMDYSGFDFGMRWTHSYTHAISDTPRVGEEVRRPRLTWNLSELAPESCWTVWRAAESSSFERVGQLVAGQSQAMSFVDMTAPATVALRYRVRRECKDTRYQWTSPEAEWLPRSARLELTLAGGNPAGGSISAEVLGANAGALELQLFDLQGRMVASARRTASGSGRDALSLGNAEEGHFRSGVYVLRARSADGRQSAGTKVVILR